MRHAQKRQMHKLYSSDTPRSAPTATRNTRVTTDAIRYSLWKRLAVILFVPILRLFLSFFFAKQYLRGKYFDQRLLGWKWAIRSFWTQKVLGINRRTPWPVSSRCSVSTSSRIVFHPDDINNFQAFGCYFQCDAATIHIGRGSYIAPNVGIITANHDLNDLKSHQPGKDVVIGDNCWIGMNSVVLPGVTLGPHTVVGAGAIVTKSFPAGNCVIAGNPARLVRSIANGQQATLQPQKKLATH